MFRDRKPDATSDIAAAFFAMREPRKFHAPCQSQSHNRFIVRTCDESRHTTVSRKKTGGVLAASSSRFNLIKRTGNPVRRVFLNHLDPQFGEAHVRIFLGLVNRAPGDVQLSGDFRFGQTCPLPRRLCQFCQICLFDEFPLSHGGM